MKLLCCLICGTRADNRCPCSQDGMLLYVYDTDVEKFWPKGMADFIEGAKGQKKAETNSPTPE